MPPEGFKLLTVDDRNTDRIRYNSQWFTTGNWNATTVGQSGTLSSANSQTASLTFTFPEPALQFAYYGMKRSGGGLYQLCMDCDPNAPNWIDIDAWDPEDTGQNPPVILYFQEFPTLGVHEVILRNTNDTRTGTSQITLDRFELSVRDPTVRTTASRSLTTTALPTTTSGAAETPTGRTGSDKTSQAEMVGTVVGGVVGGIAVLVIGALLLFLCMRRRERRRERLEGGDPSLPMASQFSGRLISVGSAPQSSISGYSHQRDQSFSSPGSPPQSISSRSYGTSSYSGMARTTPRREQDAGVILENDGGTELHGTLPPDYEQVFTRQQPRRALSMSEGGSSYSESAPIARARVAPPRSTSMYKKPLS